MVIYTIYRSTVVSHDHATIAAVLLAGVVEHGVSAAPLLGSSYPQLEGVLIQDERKQRRSILRTDLGAR
jgi:hypothetical protein